MVGDARFRAPPIDERRPADHEDSSHGDDPRPYRRPRRHPHPPSRLNEPASWSGRRDSTVAMPTKPRSAVRRLWTLPTKTAATRGTDHACEEHHLVYDTVHPSAATDRSPAPARPGRGRATHLASAERSRPAGAAPGSAAHHLRPPWPRAVARRPRAARGERKGPTRAPARLGSRPMAAAAAAMTAFAAHGTSTGCPGILEGPGTSPFPGRLGWRR
jgi:hypothetical protein